MSYWEAYIKCTENKLRSIFGSPDAGSADGKVFYIWHLHLPDNTPFTIYDWKEYGGFDNNTIIEWHIGTETPEDSDKVLNYLDENTDLETFSDRYPLF